MYAQPIFLTSEPSLPDLLSFFMSLIHCCSEDWLHELPPSLTYNSLLLADESYNHNQTSLAGKSRSIEKIILA